MEDQKLEDLWYQIHRNEVAKDCCLKGDCNPWLLQNIADRGMMNRDVQNQSYAYSSLCGNWSEMNYFLMGLIIGRLSVNDFNKKEDNKNDGNSL